MGSDPLYFSDYEREYEHSHLDNGENPTERGSERRQRVLLSVDSQVRLGHLQLLLQILERSLIGSASTIQDSQHRDLTFALNFSVCLNFRYDGQFLLLDWGGFNVLLIFCIVVCVSWLRLASLRRCHFIGWKLLQYCDCNGCYDEAIHEGRELIVVSPHLLL